MQQNFTINEPKTSFKSIISKPLGKAKNLQINANNTTKEQVQNSLINNPFKSNFTEKKVIKERGDENDNNITNIFLNKNYEIENLDNENQFHTGRWTEEEHQKFIDGILQYGNEWKKVQQLIRTRSSTQARSHAQKFFLKIKKIIQNNNVNSNDKEKIVEIIANNIYTNNINEKRNSLTKAQKEKLLNVIFSNIKYDEKNKEYNDEENEEIGLEEDNLGYEKLKEKNNDLLPKNYNADEIISGNLENKKIGLKRKLSKNFELKDMDKIFSIQKDLSHRASMDFSISKLSNTEDKRRNSFSSLRNNVNQDNKNCENNNLNNLNNNSQNNFDNFDNKNNKNNYIIHNYINVTNNYMNNNYIYNIYNPDTFNNIINNNINGFQDSFNINYDKNDSYNNEKNQNQNFNANWQYPNKLNYNSNYNFDKNISNFNGVNKLNNFNDYDNNNNDPFKLEFGIFPDKNNNNENEHQFSINEEEFTKSNNNNEDNGSIL